MFLLILTKLFLALIALIVLYVGVFGVLRILDKHSGLCFKESIAILKQDPKALSLYYSMRMLGVSLSVGLLVCICVLL